MTGRLGAVLIVVVTMTFAACSPSLAKQRPAIPESSPLIALDELAAVQAVIVASGFADSSQTFPKRPGQIACVIQGGGPPPGIRLPGTCQTSVAHNGGVFLVTLTEYWDARAFHGGDVDPSTGQLSHAWRYKVDYSGNVTFVDSSGNFPPQQVM